MKTSLVLSTIIGAGLVAAAECPAPGYSDSQGRYSCNPDHQYPEGQQCKEIDGCLFLTDASGKPVINKKTPLPGPRTGEEEGGKEVRDLGGSTTDGLTRNATLKSGQRLVLFDKESGKVLVAVGQNVVFQACDDMSVVACGIGTGTASSQRGG
ncbi:hypothetical protein E4U31_004004 [Claviceps sp. LM219 group G6]|nr:hypothetical protein E4U31_004004 [Claviceps sp. LM219 group G6]